MTLHDYYLEKTGQAPVAKKLLGFAKKPAAVVGGVASILGALKGATRPVPGESRPSAAIKEGLTTGLMFGLGTGMVLGQAVKHGDKALEYLKRTMKVI